MLKFLMLLHLVLFTEGDESNYNQLPLLSLSMCKFCYLLCLRFCYHIKPFFIQLISHLSRVVIVLSEVVFFPKIFIDLYFVKQDTGTQHAYLCNYISDQLCNIIEHASLTIRSLEPIAMHITEHLVFKQWIKKNHYNVLHN